MTSRKCSACRRYAALRACARGDHILAFHTRVTCGVTTHRASLVDDRLAVTLRLADDQDAVQSIRVRYFDGAESWTFLD